MAQEYITSILPAIKIIVSTTKPSLNYCSNLDIMDVSKLAALVHQLQHKPSATLFHQVEEEARHIQTEVICALDLTGNEIDTNEKKIMERWGKDANSLLSPECREEVKKATSKANRHLDLYVQQAALQGTAEASQKKDVKGVEQFLGFAQRPRQTFIELP